MSEDRARAIDWLLTFAAAALAATLLGVGPAPGGEPDLALVRELEQDFKLLDAEAALPPEVRQAIGIGDDPAEGRRQALAALARNVERWSQHPRVLVIVTAVAVGEEEDEAALQALDRLAAEAGDGIAQHLALVDQLHRLARGEAVRDAGLLSAALRELGASPWLLRRVAARDERNRGDAAAADRALEEARALAVAFVERFTGLMVVWITLLVLGLAILLLWPLVRRALAGAGLVGLGDTPSPFHIPATHRVVAAWFLAYLLLGLGMALFGASLGADARAQAINLTTQTLIQGGVAIALIQRFGRRIEDHLPLTIPLRLAAGPASGGRLGVAVWTLGGLALALVVVTSVSIVATALTGAPDESQRALQLFAEPGDAVARLVIALSAVVFAPIFEEILFRGFLYRNLKQLWGPGPAMVAAGLLFGLAHLEPGLILPLSALGATLAFLYERSGSLLVPIFVHALWNLGQLVLAVVLATG